VTEQHVRLTAQLYQARDDARTLLGADFSARMADLGKGIDELAAKKQISRLSAAIAMAKAAQELGKAYTAVYVLAAAVELEEPSAPTPSPESEG
jgi:hypothetical protein